MLSLQPEGCQELPGLHMSEIVMKTWMENSEGNHRKLLVKQHGEAAVNSSVHAVGA